MKTFLTLITASSFMMSIAVAKDLPYQDFTHQGIKYSTEKYYNNIYVYPKEMDFSIIEESDDELDCRRVDKSARTINHYLNEYEKSGDKSALRLAKHMAKSRGSEETDFPGTNGPAPRVFSVNSQKISQTSVLTAAKAIYEGDIEKSHFIDMEVLYKNLNTIQWQKLPNSITKKLFRHFSPAEVDLSSLLFNNGRFVLNNKFLACDLKRGLITISIQSKRNLKKSNAYEIELINILWDIYNELKQIVDSEEYKIGNQTFQAALIGYEFGKLAKRIAPFRKKYQFKNLYEKIFNPNDYLEIFDFRNIQDFKYLKFEDLSISGHINTTWSLK